MQLHYKQCRGRVELIDTQFALSELEKAKAIEHSVRCNLDYPIPVQHKMC